MNTEISIRLELIAAKAKQLAEDYKNGKLWEGELGKGLSEIDSQLRLLLQQSRNDR